ncbi:unnamed protein product, partial [marine sediment metagenome]
KAPPRNVIKAPPRDFMKENVDRWNAALERAGGDFAAWEKKVAPFHDDVRQALESRPAEFSGIVGLDGFLFFRRSLEVFVAGDLRKQKEGLNPFPVIVGFKKQLDDRGIDLLFCPIPVKAAVMPGKLSANAPPASGPYVNPYTTKLLAELAEAGVECVDLMPAFMAERDKPATEPFYMKLDTHWSHRALRVAASVFAERIKGYDWYPELVKEPVAYTVKKVTVKRRGDIVVGPRMLPAAERIKYAPMKLHAEQVLKPDGSFYKDDESSPIVVLGDS